MHRYIHKHEATICLSLLRYYIMKALRFVVMFHFQTFRHVKSTHTCDAETSEKL